MKRIKTITTGLVGVGLVSLIVMIGRMSGCAGTNALFGTGGGGGAGETQSSPGISETKTVTKTEPKEDGPRTMRKLGIDLTEDAIVVNVYVVGEQIELEGKIVTKTQLSDTLKALQISHPGKKIRVVPNGTATGRMNVYADLEEACKGLAEFHHPTPPK